MEQQQQQQCGPIVILAVDNSKHSEYAFDYYRKNSHKPGNTLHVITVVEGWHVHPMDGGPSPGHAKELQQKDTEAIAALQKKYEDLMKENDIKGEFHVIQGSHHGKHIWKDIVTYQEKHGGIMIVIGTRGQGSVRRTVMGSVSSDVVHHANCPVLVCRHE